MTESEPRVVDAPEDHRFALLADGEVAGFAEYRRNPGEISFTHTVVEDRFEGRGFGSTLAKGALDAAREEGLAVLPLCPFIRDYIERHPDYLDLVPADRRAQFGLDGAG